MDLDVCISFIIEKKKFLLKISEISLNQLFSILKE